MPPQSGSWFWKSQFPFASHQPIMSPDKHLSPQSFPSQPWTLHGFISGCTHAPLPLQIPGRFPEVELSQAVMQDSPQGFPVHVPFSPKHLLQINWIQISVCVVIISYVSLNAKCFLTIPEGSFNSLLQPFSWHIQPCNSIVWLCILWHPR